MSPEIFFIRTKKFIEAVSKMKQKRFCLIFMDPFLLCLRNKDMYVRGR